MSKKTSLKNITALVVILILLSFIGVRIFSLIEGGKEPKKPDDPFSAFVVSNYSEDRDYWKEQMDKLGTAKAYELFKVDNQKKAFGVSHALSHVFGELIYKKEGIDGFVYCDNAFSFGCYHSFFGIAVTVEGPDVIPKLAQVCLDQWQRTPACPHGIGHGILGYLGDDKLLESLQVCANLPWKGFFGCENGVFMEYNFHTMKLLDGLEVRSYDPEKPYSPCDELPKEFRDICYFSQPQWWSHVLVGDYEKIGQLCAALPERTESGACFGGVGNITPPNSSYDVERSIEVCNLMPDNRGASLCRERASWVFYSEASVKGEAYKLCEGLDPSRLVECAPKVDSAVKAK